MLQSRGSDFSGITNGIDMQVIDPEHMELLAKNYTAKTLREGKTANKLALQQRVGLPEDKDVAVLAMVTRLVGHKGIDLLCYIAERLLPAARAARDHRHGRGKIRVVSEYPA